MKRLGRWLFNLAAALSLGLALTVAVFWIYSFGTQAGVNWSQERWPDKSHWEISSVRITWMFDRFQVNYNHVVRSLPSDDEIQHFIAVRQSATGKTVWNVWPARMPRASFEKYQGMLPLAGGRPQYSHSTTKYSVGWESNEIRDLWIPYGMPLILIALLILPGIWYPRLVRCHLRQRRGQCAVCGYDLRATPERCPECGAIPKG